MDKYINKIPSETGWYFFKMTKKKKTPLIIRVVKTKDGLRMTFGLHLRITDKLYRKLYKLLSHLWWSERIQEPD